MAAKTGLAGVAMTHACRGSDDRAFLQSIGSWVMSKKVWQAPKVETTPVSMEVTMYLPAQA